MAEKMMKDVEEKLLERIDAVLKTVRHAINTSKIHKSLSPDSNERTEFEDALRNFNR